LLVVVRPNLNEVRRHLQTPVVTRFAPSPTGLLHLGHVVNAIYVWGLTQALGGCVLIRVEDHDRIRSRAHFERSLFEDLQWLGFVDPSTPFLRQQDRDAVYADALAGLRRVAHIYACDCSRSSFQGERYPGRCRERGLSEEPGRTLRVELDDATETADDLMLGRLEQSPALQCGDLALKEPAAGEAGRQGDHPWHDQTMPHGRTSVRMLPVSMRREESFGYSPLSRSVSATRSASSGGNPACRARRSASAPKRR
jgi:hypothetical protein